VSYCHLHHSVLSHSGGLPPREWDSCSSHIWPCMQPRNCVAMCRNVSNLCCIGDRNCVVGLTGLAHLLAGPANKTIHKQWPDLWQIAQNNATACNPYGNRLVNNVYANTTQFMSSATPADVVSWGGEISNNTCATPPAANATCTCCSTACTCPLPWEPAPACPMNATNPGRAYMDCEFDVQIGLYTGTPPPAGNSTPYQNITVSVHADADDCFRIEGCGTKGPSAPSCMSGWNVTTR